MWRLIHTLRLLGLIPGMHPPAVALSHVNTPARGAAPEPRVAVTTPREDDVCERWRCAVRCAARDSEVRESLCGGAVAGVDSRCGGQSLRWRSSP